jgi:DNA-binding SARP family transcriptional activator
MWEAAVQEAQSGLRGDIRLSLLGEFTLAAENHRIDVPLGSQRVIAFVALSHTPPSRGRICDTLWPDTDSSQSAACLRTAIWRASLGGCSVLSSFQDRLALADNVGSDVAATAAIVAKMSKNPGYVPEPEGQALFCGELLSAWDEEWLIAPRERIRNQHVHVLERLCAVHAQRGNFDRAIDAGLAAVQADPLRDRAHAELLRAYIADGHRARAVRHFRHYAAMLDAELGIEPDPEVAELVAPMISRAGTLRRGRWAEPSTLRAGQTA